MYSEMFWHVIVILDIYLSTYVLVFRSCHILYEVQYTHFLIGFFSCCIKWKLDEFIYSMFLLVLQLKILRKISNNYMYLVYP